MPLRIIAWMLLLPGLLALPGTTGAQEPTQAIINYVEVAESGQALQLRLYFTINDASGQAVPNSQVSVAQMILSNGERADAEVGQPDTPYYLVLVLDASGSMGGAETDMQRAAAQLIQNAPDRAQFAVIRFNQQIDVLQDFSDERTRIINDAITQIRPINLSGTCLYDASLRALELLATRPSGRRAVIVFTDGKDQVLDGSPCSRGTYNDVVATATSAAQRAPIYTIGLRGRQDPINELELRSMAESTGGLSAIGAQADLQGLFSRILDGLRNQWSATALVYPPQGMVGVSLFVTLANGTLLQPAGNTFLSPRSYTAPAAEATLTPVANPLSIEIRTLQIDTASDNLIVETVVQNAESVTEYRLDLFDDGNLLRGTYRVAVPLAPRQPLPLGDLEAGRYSLVIYAVDASGGQLGRSDEEAFA